MFTPYSFLLSCNVDTWNTIEWQPIFTSKLFYRLQFGDLLKALFHAVLIYLCCHCCQPQSQSDMTWLLTLQFRFALSFFMCFRTQTLCTFHVKNNHKSSNSFHLLLQNLDNKNTSLGYWMLVVVKHKLSLRCDGFLQDSEIPRAANQLPTYKEHVPITV